RATRLAGNAPPAQPLLAPFLGELLVAPGGRHSGKQLQMHRSLVGAHPLAPGLFGGEAEHWRKTGHCAAEQVVDDGQRGLSRPRRDRIAVERVLADVEIEL